MAKKTAVKSKQTAGEQSVKPSSAPKPRRKSSTTDKGASTKKAAAKKRTPAKKADPVQETKVPDRALKAKSGVKTKRSSAGKVGLVDNVKDKIAKVAHSLADKIRGAENAAKK